MERRALNNLIEWDKTKNRKPLMVWGARQVGKTYLIRDLFAENYYKNNYIYIDFQRDKDAKKKLYGISNPKQIIEYLTVRVRKDIDSNTLIIFDEIQSCPSIITSLKYFCQDYRDIPVIATGSLVRTKLNRDVKDEEILFPVGKINELNVYPLTFDEYLLNTNKQLYDLIYKSYKEGKALDNGIHDIALSYFYRFILIGGMPEVVNNYIEEENLLHSINIIKEVYSNYISDMSMYQKSENTILKTRDIYNHIYKQLNKESKNFSPGLIKHGSKTRDYYSPIEWLRLANVVFKSYQTKEHVTLPLIENSDDSFRLYLGDLGLFTYQSNINATSFLSKDIENTLAGIFYENYVALEMVARDLKLFYWKGKRSNELEFIVEYNNGLVPIDVKKGRSGLNSLDYFSNHNKYEFVIKISNNNIGYNLEKRLLTIPFYYVPFVIDDLSNNNKIPFC